MERPIRIFNLRHLAAWLAACGFCSTAWTADALCTSAEQVVHEEAFVAIGQIEQWVTINGARCANPVILFLHGGPGNTMTPYSDEIYGAWEKDFTMVQWDQRAAGRTYGRNPPAEESTLTIERMSADGIELAEYLTRHLGQEKIVLMGGSWGSILGVHMVKSRPDLFHAWVGISQVVSYRDNESASYTKVLELARSAADTTTLASLEAIGPPPWTQPRNFGILRRATRTFEAKVATAAPPSWWLASADYTGAQALKDYTDGEDFSFLQFVGYKGDGMFSKVDLPALGMDFKLPVFLIHGAEDLVATPEIAQRYFDGINAPSKQFVLLPHTGHDPNAAMLEAEYQILVKHVRPLLQ